MLTVAIFTLPSAAALAQVVEPPTPAEPIPPPPLEPPPPTLDAPVITPSEPAPVIVPRSFAEDRLPEEFFDKNGELRRKLAPIPGMDPPVEYEANTKPVVGLWVSGVASLGGGYAVSAFSAGFGYALSDFCLFSGCEKESDYLLGFIPLFGGFVAAGKSTIPPGMKVLFVTSGVIQNAGVALLISGLAAKQPVWVLRDKTLAIEVGPGSAGLSGEF